MIVFRVILLFSTRRCFRLNTFLEEIPLARINTRVDGQKKISKRFKPKWEVHIPDLTILYFAIIIL